MDKGRKRIEYGDRIFARLTKGRRTVIEFMVNRVADMTDLLRELRHLASGVKGLTTLYVRNQSKGWSIERPLMLYSANVADRPYAEATPSAGISSPHTMLFPWETH